MRRFLAALVTLAALSCFADADLYIDLTYFKANPATNRWTTLQWMNPVPGNLYNYTSTAAGGFWVSNATVGDIVGTVKQKGTASEIRFQVTIGDDDTGTLYASNITSVLGIQTYPSTARSSYSIAAANNRFARIGSGGLSFVPQLGSANLTNWSALATNVLGSLVGSSPNALTNGDTRAISLASSLSVTSTVIANGNVVVGGVIYGNAAGVTNLPPIGFAATNTGTAGQVFKKIDANTGYWADDDGGGSVSFASVANTYTGLVFTAREGAPLNINIGNLKRLRMDLSAQTPDIWLLGDDALNPHNTLIESLDNWATRGGSTLGWDIGPYMGTWYAGTITHPTWAGTVEPFNSYVGMANGSSITNQFNSYGGAINGITTTHVAPLFWKSNSFGTLTVITQSLVSGVLGTPGVLKVIDCNNASTLTAATTNIYLGAAVPNLTASVYSSGTNMIYSIAQVNTNAGSGYSFSQFHGGSFDINNLMTNSFKSNTLRQFMAPFPPSLVLFHDGNTSNSLYNGLSLFHQMVTNAGYTTDIASVSGIPRTNDLDTARTERLSVLNWARDTGRTALDTWSLFEPFDVTSFIPYYTDDAVHLTTLGHEAVTSRVIGWLGLDAASLTTLQYRYRETISNVITATISSPEGSSGGIRFSNNIYVGWPSNSRRIIDNRATVGTATAAGSTSHTIQTYSENNNHGLGIGVADGVTGGYWSSDGSLLFAYMNGGSGSLRARFDLANSTNYFTGGLGASFFKGAASWTNLTDVPAGFADGTDDGSGGSFTLTMNPNQFGQAGGTTNFISGAATTNINHWKTLVLRSEDAGNDITLSNHSEKILINSTASPFTADTEIGEDIKTRTFYGTSNNITGGISAGSIGTTTLNVSGAATVSQGVLYATNGLASGYPIDFSKSFFGLATNNTVPVGVATGWINTNWNQCMWGITNTAGSGTPIQISVPAWGQYLPGGGTVPYVTNYAIVLFWSTYGAGTNYMVISR